MQKEMNLLLASELQDVFDQVCVSHKHSPAANTPDAEFLPNFLGGGIFLHHVLVRFPQGGNLLPTRPATNWDLHAITTLKSE
jgi:hypothetical protein